MNICIVCGARPNFIKVAPLVRAIMRGELPATPNKEEVNYSLVYTGAKDDPTLESELFSDIQIRRPDVYLGVTSQNLNEITGQVMQAFELYLQQHPTDTVVVEDDLASTMAVAIVAKKQGLRLAHIAAGTRSFDINMPKEVNRLVIDGLSDILFTAGASNSSIASREGAELSKVYMVGNILIDNLRFIHDRMLKPHAMYGLGLDKGQYLAFTLNRKALIADTDKLRRMVRAITDNCKELRVLAPLHTEARKVMEKILKEDHVKHFFTLGAMSYREFSFLTANAAGIITDSSSVADEATFNHVPCVTLNSYTEHIETVTQGTNELVGEDPARLGECVAAIAAGKWKEGTLPDRWDGRTAERILRILME